VSSAGATRQPQPRLALRLRLASGPCCIPLDRVQHVTGYATLSGPADDYFLGWLMFHGQQVPVFDLDRVVCDQATPQEFGTRIILIGEVGSMPIRYVGLLAAGVTDTIADGTQDAPTLDLESYLPMIYAMIPKEDVPA
jgi:chemotaxis signal transduction protein